MCRLSERPLCQRCLPLRRIEHQHNSAVNHVPIGPSEFVERVRDKARLVNTNALQQRLMPKGATSNNGSESIYDTKGEYALYGPGDQAEREGVRVILFPGLDVKGE